MNPLQKQVDGQHYKDMAIQPVEFIHANGIGYFEGNVIKYVTRWRKKNGIVDLEKAKHYVELLISMETRRLAALSSVVPTENQKVGVPNESTQSQTAQRS